MDNNKNKKKNSFEALEFENLRDYGEPDIVVKDNIDRNVSLFTTIGETVELYTGKFIKSIIKMNS